MATVSVPHSAVHHITADGASIEFTSTYVKLYKQFSKPPKDSFIVYISPTHALYIKNTTQAH